MSADRPVGSSPIVFEHSFAHALPGGFVPVAPTPVPAPQFVQFNDVLAAELGLDPTRLRAAEGLAWFAGNAVPPGAEPIALAYAGHQFGQFVPQLGDGRALLLGELIDASGRRRDIALKGSGPTPFSRGGDGKAALGPVLREYLLGEAMHALGIASTRALAAVRSGEPVFRDGLLPGAVLTRIAASHLRVGTFEFFAVRGDLDHLRRLLDYTLARHYPEQREADNPALALITAVVRVQARLIARWMAVGFIHGVMNTDNMALSGETLDYGPCAFMDSYHPDTVFSSIDRRGRYAYANQPAIALWNLARFAETLLPLIDPEQTRAIELASEAVHGFQGEYESAWLALLRAKLGLSSAEPDDPALFARWLQLMQDQQADWTLTWRALAQVLRGNPAPLLARFADASAVHPWLADWQARLAREPIDPLARAAAMDAVNPWLIARNHQVEAALAAAVHDGDLGPFAALLTALRSPFTVDPTHAAYADPPPPGFSDSYRTFCGT